MLTFLVCYWHTFLHALACLETRFMTLQAMHPPPSSVDYELRYALRINLLRGVIVRCAAQRKGLVALFVMLSNYMHDMATGIFAVAAVAAWVLTRMDPEPPAVPTVRHLARTLTRFGWHAFFWILVLGVVRAVTYREYEWSEAAGRHQVTVLAVKHVILTTLVVFGLIALMRARRLAHRADHRVTESR